MKYVDEMICFQEVPDEITLSFSISNCPRRCAGCHSPYLAQDVGSSIEDRINDALRANMGLISCVLFLGGDDDKQVSELEKCIDTCKEAGLKVALYSGSDEFPERIADKLDYVKYGHYDEQRGGLNNPNTNQRMLKRNGNEWIDITSRFWKKTKEIYEN